MHAGDGDAVLEAHQFSEHFRALDDGDLELVSLGDLGIALRNGRTGDDDFGAVHILGAVSFEDDCAKMFEALRNRGGFEVGSGNLVTQVKQDFGDTTHANAANADEMDALNFSEQSSSQVLDVSETLSGNSSLMRGQF